MRDVTLTIHFVIVVFFFVTASLVWWPEFLATDPRVGVRFPTIPDFLRSSGSGTGPTR
jgi:hypothetical protein